MSSKWLKNWFSNFLPFDTPLLYDDILFETPENFYQAMKTLDKTERKKIAKMAPAQAKKYIRTIEIRKDWPEIKLEVMEWILRKKFAPGTSWYKKLLETNEEIIEWNNWKDYFWGKDILTNKGQNFLGQILMRIRDEYKQNSSL